MKKRGLIVFVFILFFFFSFVYADSTFSLNGEEGWAYRKSHVVGNASGAGENYTVQIIVKNATGTDNLNVVYLNSTTTARTRSDFGDVRFGDGSGNIFNYWIEELNSGVNATFWVKISGDLSSSNQTIYIYYGNPSATNVSNGTATFQFFDDFNDGSIDSNKWYSAGGITTSVSESGGYGRVSGSSSGTWNVGYFKTKSTFSPNSSIRAKQYFYQASANIDSASGFLDPSVILYIGGGLINTNYLRLYKYSWVSYGAPDHDLLTYGNSNYAENSTVNPRDAWRTIEHRWTPTKLSLFYNEATQSTLSNSSTISTISLPAGFLIDSGSGANGYIYTDWFVVRKYVESEPSHLSWGTEESLPTNYLGYPNGARFVSISGEGSTTPYGSTVGTCNEGDTGTWDYVQTICDRNGTYFTANNKSFAFAPTSNAGSTWSRGLATEAGVLVIDLGKDRTYNELRVFQMFSDGKVTAVQLFENSSVPGTWTAAFNKTSVGAGSGSSVTGGYMVTNPTNISFANTTSRYVQLKFWNNGSYGSSSYIEVFSAKLFGDGNGVAEVPSCTPVWENTTWTDWANLSCTNNLINQSRSLVQYDSNFCGEVDNETFYEYKTDLDCSVNLEIVSPENTTYTNLSQLLNISSNGISIWYNWNGTNTTYSSSSSVLFGEGANILIAYANNSFSDITSIQRIFNIDTTAPAISIISPENTTYNSTRVLLNLSSDGEILFYTWNGTNITYSSASYVEFNAGNNTLEVYSNDSVGNLNATSVKFYCYYDSDFDNVRDDEDAINGNVSNIAQEGITNINLSVGGNYSVDTASGENEVVVYESSTPVLNFTYNFSKSSLNLSKISLIKSEDYLIVNLSGQLQKEYNKSIYFEDNDFVSLCVKDSEVASISEMSESCSGNNETDFSSCLGNSNETSFGQLTCVDFGNTIKISNLRHSAVRGFSSIPTISSGGGSSHTYTTKKICLQNWSCSSWSFCSKNFTQERTCMDLNNCLNESSKPLAFRTCPSLLFDSLVTIETRNVYPWNDLKFKVNLKEVNQSDRVDIVVLYKISRNKNIIYEESETKSIIDDLEYEKTIENLNLPNGEYSLEVIVEYGKNQISSSEQYFSIRGSSDMIIYSVIFLVIILLGYSLYKSRKHEEEIEEKLEEIEDKLEGIPQRVKLKNKNEKANFVQRLEFKEIAIKIYAKLRVLGSFVYRKIKNLYLKIENKNLRKEVLEKLKSLEEDYEIELIESKVKKTRKKIKKGEIKDSEDILKKL